MKTVFLRLLLSALALWILAAAILTIAGCNDHLEKSDLALVLGSKVELDGKPSRRLQARLDRAVELFRAGYFRQVLVSGGVGKEGYDEAKVMAEYLFQKGIPSEVILQDNKGKTTFDSARATAQLSREHEFKSVIVVSQYFHIPRSVFALRKVGIASVFHAHANYVEWLREPYSITRELLGYLTYCFKDYSQIVPDSTPDSTTPTTR
jgi:vancomycin permeability regulator SanA